MSVSRAKRLMREGDARTQRALLGDFFPEDIHAYRVDRHTFTIYVGGDPQAHENVSDFEHGEPGVEHNMADRFEINMNMLSGIDSKRPILVVLSSCGGSWEDGMKMFSTILYCPNPVTLLATKWARSMTSIIPLAADKFVIQPPARYMIHRGSYGFGGLDQEADTHDIERRLSRDTMIRLYVARLKSQGEFSSRGERDIKRMLDRWLERQIDVWFSADRAKEVGFADDVFDGNWDSLRRLDVNHGRRALLSAVLRKKRRVKIDVVDDD